MTVLLVTYPTDQGTHFDVDYYVTTHMQMVRDAWGPHGLIDAHALVPQGDAGFHAIAHITFPGPDALAAAMADPKTAAVTADVANFTDIQPAIHTMAVA